LGKAFEPQSSRKRGWSRWWLIARYELRKRHAEPDLGTERQAA
jgi:hypothetical protein